MATVDWKMARRRPVAEEMSDRMEGFKRTAGRVIRDADRLARMRDDALGGVRFANMSPGRRADAAAKILGLDGDGPDDVARAGEVLRLYDILGANPEGLEKDDADAVKAARHDAGRRLADNGLPSSADELRRAATAVLGPESTWSRYASDPRLKDLLTGWKVYGSDGGYLRRAPGLSTRPAMVGADLPTTSLESGLRRLPTAAQTALRTPLRAARMVAASAGGLARYPLRAAGWFLDEDLSGGLDRDVRRWNNDDRVDDAVDEWENREYRTGRESHRIGRSAAGDVLHSDAAAVASDVGKQLLFLVAASRLYGNRLPQAFAANVGMDTYDSARNDLGLSFGKSLAYGAGHGVADALMWSLPVGGALGRLRLPNWAAGAGEGYLKMFGSGQLAKNVQDNMVEDVRSGWRKQDGGTTTPAPMYSAERHALLQDALALRDATGDEARAQEFYGRGARRLDVAADLAREWKTNRAKELETMINDHRRRADSALATGDALPGDFDAGRALEELKYLKANQAAKGGRASRAAVGGGEAMLMATAPEYARVDLGNLPDEAALASVHKVDMNPEVTVRGMVTDGADFPYDFSMEGDFSPDGVPWSSLDPGEVNANAFAYGDGHAVTKARGDYFALTDNEQKVFDRLTKEGVNPHDARVRKLRAMKEAGDRGLDEIKRLAWAERKNRDIELAYRLGGENWRDYYVETTADMIGGDRLREGIAGDINARADHLRGQYDYLAGAGRGREAERAMDDLHAFRKRAQYLAARYGLHPELARMDRDRTFLETVRGGQLGQRLSIRGVYPQSLYVETGHYGTEPSKYAGAAKALSDRFGPAVQFDPALSPQAADAAAYADEYRRDVDAYSFWNMPYVPDESLNSRYSLPVLDGETEAPPWLQRAVRRRRKLTRAKPTHGDLEGGETSEGDVDLNGDGTAVDHGADLEDFKAEEAKDPDVEAWIDKASAARENGEGESKAGDPDVAAWVDKVSADREREAQGAQDQPKQVGPAMSGEAAKAGLQMKQVGPAMSGDAARAGLQMKQVGPAMSGDAAKAGLQMKQVGPAMSGNDAKAGLQMKQIGPDMGGGGSGGLAERKANADAYQERIEAAGLTGKEAARALRDMVYSGNTDRLDKAEEEARRKAAGAAAAQAMEPKEKEPLPGVRPKRRRRG